MNNITPISSVSFNGLIINGTVAEKNVKRLGDFASKYENINFIKDLEINYGVDAVLDKDITTMSFAHQKFGDLTEKYDCGKYPLGNVFMEVSNIIKNIKAALSKAEKDFQKALSEKEKIKRGC